MTEQKNGSRPGREREPKYGWRRVQSQHENNFHIGNWQSSFVARYQRRLEKRVHERLLRPFQCSACGELALDPLGYNRGETGRKEWLCGCTEGGPS